ncbi:MAG: MOSC domain-containing protein, partial [Pyrinomonadaceae bacterium]
NAERNEAVEDADEGVRVPLPMNRFRPNVVVQGSGPFAEDKWAKIRIGETIFRVAKPCARCQIPTIDQVRGEFDGKEPSRTFATFRMAKQAFPDTYEALRLTPNSVLFGENLIPENPGGTLSVGDAVEVLEYRS